MKTEDMVGLRFTRWTVLREAERYPNGQRRLECRCSCGAVVVVAASSLRSLKSRSCGCLERELKSEWHAKQDYARNRLRPLYKTWAGIIQRCENPNHAEHTNYGGRGIAMCPEWRADFRIFEAQVGERPKGMTLDRIDNDGHYEPGNVRWATRSQQRINQRRVGTLQAERDMWRDRALALGWVDSDQTSDAPGGIQ